MKVKEAIEKGITNKENVIAFIEGYDDWGRFVEDLKDFYKSPVIWISDEEAEDWNNVLNAEIVENPAAEVYELFN